MTDVEDAPPCCPGCGSPTFTLTLRYGSGATTVTERAPSWCRDCLQAKCVAARAGECHCDDGAHGHPLTMRG